MRSPAGPLSSGLSGAALLVRRLRLQTRRALRRLPLSQSFLVAAALVLAAAMILLGLWIGLYLRNSITEGVASTAAATIESLIARDLRDLQPDRPITAAERAKLAEVFAIGNEGDTTRLLYIRLRALDGTIFYTSPGEFTNTLESETFDRALRGEVVARLEQLTHHGSGATGESAIDVIEIYAPLRRAGTNRIFAVAELCYGAESLTAILTRAQIDVWVLVGAVGIAATGILYVLVEQASRTIIGQRQRLAHNLALSRALSDENHALHAASEQLRLDASFANETLLARTGSDLHDGPIQLLTLIILNLTNLARNRPDDGVSRNLQSSIALATDTMEELRNISSGLVLPELGDLDLRHAIRLAVSRHEETTGTSVRQHVARLPKTSPMAVKICAYRVVQEALRSAHRHGAPTGQQVAAAVEDDVLTLSITNMARETGIGEHLNADTTHLGLRGMRFRVEALGGTLRADIGAPRTVVTATIPLRNPPASPPSPRN